MNKLLKISLISLLAVAVVGGVAAPKPANATMTVGALTISSSGTLRVDGATGSAIDIGDASQTGTISVGASGGAMTLNLATGNSTKTTNIGTGNVVDTINIGTGGGNDIIAIGTAAGSSSLTLLSGSGDMTFDSEDAYLFTLAAASEIDVTVAASTVTSGVIDMNVTAGNAAVSAIDLALTQNTGAGTGVDVIGLNMLLTQSDADGDMFGIKIVAADGAAVAGSYEAAITIDNADASTAGSMPDAIIITSSGINTGVTDAIDVSDTNITNAINVGVNTILGTTAVIDFTDLDVDADGLMAFASDGAGDQITIVAPAADFQAMVVDATTAVSTQTAGMIDLNVKTITSTAVGGVALALAVNDAASGITVYGNKTDVTVDTDVGHGHTVYGEYIGITANDADSTIYGLAIQAEDAATQLVTAGLLINNAQSSAINMTDGIKITAGNANNIVDAIDASDAEITNAINIGVNAIVGTQFAVAHTTGAVTLTQQAVGTIPLLVTGLANGTTHAIDINTSNEGGNVIDITWGTETQAENIAGISINMGALTSYTGKTLYGIHVNDQVGATDATEYGIYIEGTNWDHGLNVADTSLFAGAITATGGITGSGDFAFAAALAGGADVSVATSAADTAGSTLDIVSGIGGTDGSVDGGNAGGAITITGGAAGAAGAGQDGGTGGAITITGGASTALNGGGSNDGSGGDVVLVGGASTATGTGVTGYVRVGSPTVGSTKAINLLAVGGGLEVDGTTKLDGDVQFGNTCTDTVSTNAATCEGNAGVITDDTTDINADADRTDITLTNASISASSVIIISQCGTPDATANLVAHAVPGSGTAVIHVQNVGAGNYTTNSAAKYCFIVIN